MAGADLRNVVAGRGGNAVSTLPSPYYDRDGITIGIMFRNVVDCEHEQ